MNGFLRLWRYFSAVLLFVYLIAIIFGYTLNRWLGIDFFPTQKLDDPRNIAVLFGVICLGLFLAWPWLSNIRKLKIGPVEIENESVSGLPSIDAADKSYESVIGNIRDNFLYLGIDRRKAAQYKEAYSFYLSAHNMWPSMLSAYRVLESLCLSDNPKDSDIDKRFEECLKMANGTSDKWSGREKFRDRILKIQEEITSEKKEGKGKGKGKDKDKVKFILKEIMEYFV